MSFQYVNVATRRLQNVTSIRDCGDTSSDRMSLQFAGMRVYDVYDTILWSDDDDD